MTNATLRPTRRPFLLGSLCGAAAIATLLVGGFTLDDDPVESAALLSPSAAFAGHPAAAAVGTQFSDVAEAVLPSVVWIETVTITHPSDSRFGGNREFFGRFFDDRSQGGQRQHRERGLGSGVIISDDGYIVTNHHVAGEADELEVTLNDGRKFDAKLVGTDPDTDLAVLKLQGEVTGLAPLNLGDSEALRLGEVVMAVGNPFGLRGSVSLGIVSAKDRNSVGQNRYENFIQTDAAINQGNSGGALVNMSGELVGINNMIFSPTTRFGAGGNVGIGFAIPSNQARPIIDSLISKGRVDRGWLGVHIQDLTPAMTAGFSLEAETRGVILAQVTDGSPAEKGGVKDGDVVVSVDGNPTDDTTDLRNLIAAAGPGHKAKLEIYRNGKRKSLTVKLGELPRTNAPPAEVAVEEEKGVDVDGLQLGELKAYRDGFGLPADLRNGVVVTGVAPGSSAADAKLRMGDVIVEVNQVPVKSVPTFLRALNAAPAASLLLVRRGKATIYVALD
jgi:serine protease Do